MPTLALSGTPSFLPQSKDKHGMLTHDSKSAISVNVSVNGFPSLCVSSATDWQPVHDCEFDKEKKMDASVGSMGVWWLALSPHSKKIIGLNPPSGQGLSAWRNHHHNPELEKWKTIDGWMAASVLCSVLGIFDHT